MVIEQNKDLRTAIRFGRTEIWAGTFSEKARIG